MKTRVLTALAIIAVALLAFYIGAPAFYVIVPILLIMSQHEVLGAFLKAGRKISIWPVYLVGVLISPAVLLGGMNGAISVMIIAFMYQMAVVMLGDDPTPERIVAGSFSVFYPALPMVVLLLLATESKESLCALACGGFAAAGCDIFGLLVGSKFGKKRLCEALSPKKSVEGAIAGIFGGVLFAVTVKFLWQAVLGVDIKLFVAAMIGLVGAFFGILGDLFASGIKRLCGIKDYSSLLPGHGGVTDRLDSIYFSAFGAYLVLAIVSML